MSLAEVRAKIVAVRESAALAPYGEPYGHTADAINFLADALNEIVKIIEQRDRAIGFRE
jgi:hypothetical protein